jgi:hypothetical protein
MSVTEQLGALGSWSLTLKPDCPKEILDQLGYFGHIVILRGDVDVSQANPTVLLQQARYVGVLREKPTDAHSLSGSGLIFWLGDENDVGKAIEGSLAFTAKSLTYCVTAVLPPAVHVGTIHDPGGTYTGTQSWESPRKSLDTITTAFGVEYVVRGNFTVDVGTQAQLYRATPSTILSARGAGEDMDVQAIGTSFAPDNSAVDYITRVVMLGQKTDPSGTSVPFVEGTANAASVPYLDPWGNPVQFTRVISDSGQTAGSVAAAAAAELAASSRLKNIVKVTAENFEVSGNIVVGDMAWVFDPDNGIYDATQQLDFRGEVIHPAVVRISAATWPVTREHTVAFRTGSGVMVDLTRWVAWETGSTDLTIGDLPKTLTSGSSVVQDRVQSAPDGTTPNAPTGLSLTTTSTQSSTGQSSATVTASWTAPALNTDGSVLTDLDYYLVQYRWHGRAPLWDSRIAPTTSIDIPGLSVGLLYDVQVAAVDTTGHTSAFTAVGQITAAADSTAPNPPSDPVVASYLGQLRIAWDGKDNLGAAMPSDFNYVEVHVSATSGFTPDRSPGSATLVDQLSTAGVSFATAPYGATRYVKLVAVDNSHNASSPSNQVAGSTVQVADGDIASLNVGKLVAGIMTADVTISGRFATALAEARVELNSLGLQKWDASNNLMVSLTGTDNLLVGTFKTAISGRRIEMGSAGTTGQVNFIAPDGTVTFINARTESSGIEAIQFGVGDGSGNLLSPTSLWNRINYNNDHGGWANYRANRHEFFMGGTNSAAGGDSAHPGLFHIFETSNYGTSSNALRFEINNTGTYVYDSFRVRLQLAGDFIYWDNVGNPRVEVNTSDQQTRLWILDSSGTGFAAITLKQGVVSLTSPSMTFSNKSGFGGGINYAQSINSIQIVDISTSNFLHAASAGWDVPSDERGKAGIVDAPHDFSALVRSAKPRSYWRLKADGKRQGKAKELGLVAQEAPDAIVTGNDEQLLVSLYPMATVLWGAMHQVLARLDALEGKSA